ncbi:tyrosine-type recombinase/integrase [Ancylobacter radicis]|nr:tyrosine-type recombinase/integrase [Ancylobacter radicis]
MAEYQACLDKKAAPKIEPGARRTKPGTIGDLIARYYRSPEFLGLADSTKRNYRRQLDGFKADHGDKRVAMLERQHIRAIIGAMDATPEAANGLLDRIKTLMAMALDEGMRRDNPTIGLRGFKVRTEGHHTWSEGEIAAFEKRHPIGTRARLAMALMLYTGQRRSDAITMGWQHVVEGRIRVRQQKTGAVLEIPIHEDLAAVLASLPRDNLTFLMTEQGRPFTAAGFGNAFRAYCDEAGLKHCSAHGLRKAAARRLAEAGSSNQQIKAVTGHRTEAEVSRYTKAAEQRTLADQVVQHLGRRKTGTNLANTAEAVSQNEEKDDEKSID